MNTVISAFKTRKNSNSNSANETNVNNSNSLTINSVGNTAATTTNGVVGGIGGVGGGGSGTALKKKPFNSQGNSYQYLRHIREIDTATKMCSPVVVTNNLLETDMISFRPPDLDSEIKSLNLLPVKVAPPTTTTTTTNDIADCNMNADAEKVWSPVVSLNENGNIDECDNVSYSPILSVNNSAIQMSEQIEMDDDESEEHSIAACTSSSSEHSNSTVVHLPTTLPFHQKKEQKKQSKNPAKNTNNQQSQSSASSKINNIELNLDATITQCADQIDSASVISSNNDADTLPTTDLNSNGKVLTKIPKTLSITSPIILPNGQSSICSHPTKIDSNSTANTPKHIRYAKPRLSLSRFNNHSMPSVHGRPNASFSNGCMNSMSQTTDGNGHNPPKRTSTHQRNLSLDFRSMGILLPPVSQVTARINMTQHHRNRSLDSALQRIPEVEVSSPNNENENTFCTQSILGSCATKVANVASPLNQQQQQITPVVQSPCKSDITEIDNNTDAVIVNDQKVVVKEQLEIAKSYPLSNNNSSKFDTLSIRPTSSKLNIKTEPITSATDSKFSNNKNNINNIDTTNGKKKREDLTSLGSDDSGIICGSETDQISFGQICQSHESLDSGEMDGEEECTDILDTNSMDEEYGNLQSDLCFFQTTESKCLPTILARKLKQKRHNEIKNGNNNTQRSNNKTLNLSIISSNGDCVKSTVANNDSSITTTPNTPTPTPTNSSPPSLLSTSSSSSTINATKSQKNDDETTKNDVLFRNFFGATKNAIFRTAQSIIENHEKKNAAKNKNDIDNINSPTSSENHVKSPTEILKKKEFFGLITSHSNKKNASNNTPNGKSPPILLTPATPAPQETENCHIVEKTLNLHLPNATILTSANRAMSTSNSSLNKRVPGVVKCFVKEEININDNLQKTEKGPSGLLRFFESPVFNIHFAIHYLFYSKEPGVLSFIGNKIFSFPDQEVDLYIPQLIVMYIQMDELAEVLDPYLTKRCQKSVDFSLKCLWLLEAYNYQIDLISNNPRKSQLALMKEIFSKKERKILQNKNNANTPLASIPTTLVVPPMSVKKTHHRSQSDATLLLSESRRCPSSDLLKLTNRSPYQIPSHFNNQNLNITNYKICLGDLTSGRAFDNGCTCFETVRGQVNGLLGHKTVCFCGAPKTAPEKEFMKALINVGKNLTTLTTKAEKTSALRMLLNLINKNLPARVWLPLYSDIPHHVVRITEEKTAVLNSKDKTPYIIYVEVLEVADIYSSPLIPKMMPSLRHTKSEENLDGTCMQMHLLNCRLTNDGCCKTKDSTTTINTDCCASNMNGANDDAPMMYNGSLHTFSGGHIHIDDIWSQEDDEITEQYLNLQKCSERDAISQMSLDSCDSRDQNAPALFNIGDVRLRHCNNLTCENTKSFSNDPEDPSAAALKEPWHEKEKQIRDSSPYGHLSNWRLLSAIVKCGDDLRQELMATQLLQMFKIIWQEENVNLWVRPYKIVCLSNDSGLIEPILNTVSLHQIKKNSNKSLRDYFIDEYGATDGERFCMAQKNFVQSCAAYCLISYLLQVKDRHNGNILLHSDGHIIHIDFGFILSISPKNLGFEQSPFKLTHEFVDVMGGTTSEHWLEFNRLLLTGMMTARKHMDRIINFVEIMRSNAQLPCFRNGCSGTVQNLRKRFHMNLTEQEMEKKIEQLVQDSLKSLSTKLYDGYQYYTNGIL